MSKPILTPQATLYTEAFTAKSKGDLMKAIELYQKLVELNHHNYYALSQLAICYRELGNFEKSFEYLDKALSTNPRDANALLNKGICYAQLMNYNKALQCFESCGATINQNKSSLIHFYKANCYKEMHDFENALEHYNIALTESTSVKDKALDNVVLRELYINKAYSEYKMNNYLGCLASIDKISKNNGNSTLEHKILNLKGMVLYNMKQYIEAINEFEKCILLS